MTVGDKTFKGLGVPLQGEFEVKQLTAATDFMTMTAAESISGDFLVMRDSDLTEVLKVFSHGGMRIDNTTDDGTRGMDIRHTGERVLSGFNTALNVVETFASTNDASQIYSGRFQLDTSGGTHGGGRESVLCLYYLTGSSAEGTSHGQSFIYVTDGGTDPQSFIHFGNDIGTCGGIIRPSTETASTHAIRCYIHTTPYYIMLTSCTKS